MNLTERAAKEYNNKRLHRQDNEAGFIAGAEWERQYNAIPQSELLSQIESAIKTTLVIQNKDSIHFTMAAIKELLNPKK